MKKRKLISALIIGMIFTATSVLGYATVSYVLDKTVDTSATVGETVVYADGLIIELASFDPYTLTYFEIDETDTSKHYITYIYNYTILVEGMNIEVSSLSNDIIVSEISNDATTISITFSLNQEQTFNNGDIVNIQFYFEAVEEYVININTATDVELLGLLFSEYEIAIYHSVIASGNFLDYDDFITRMGIIGLNAAHEQQYIDGLFIVE